MARLSFSSRVKLLLAWVGLGAAVSANAQQPSGGLKSDPQQQVLPADATLAKPTLPTALPASLFASAPSVIILGEIHSNAADAQVEKESLAALKELGYRQLAIELPRDFQAAVDQYLKSARGPNDHDNLVRNVMAIETHSDPKSIDDDTLKGYARAEAPSFRNLFNSVRIAAAAADQGYKVRLMDVTDDKVASLGGTSQNDNVQLRNEAMAPEIAAMFKSGGGVLVIVGDAHLHSYFSGEHPLQKELSKYGVPAETFDLAYNGASPELAIKIPAAQITPHNVVDNAAEIRAIVLQELNAGAVQDSSHSNDISPVVIPDGPVLTENK